VRGVDGTAEAADDAEEADDDDEAATHAGG
jgi:hypothetical protein